MAIPLNRPPDAQTSCAPSTGSSTFCKKAPLEQAQLEAIFESITDGLIVTDVQGRILYMNQAIKALLNIECDPEGLTMPTLEAMFGFTALNAQGQPITTAQRPITRYLQGGLYP